MESDPSKFQRLWAPWRMEYISGHKSERPAEVQSPSSAKDTTSDCFLCRAAEEKPSSQNLVIHHDAKIVTLLNRYPYNNGHLLIAPTEHLATLDQLSASAVSQWHKVLVRMIAALENVLHSDGMNIGLNLGRAAGAGVPDHLHWHVVPRWNGDHNFMPTIAATKTIPQSLEALWELLREELENSP